MNKELSTFEGIARIKNFTDKKVIEANRFSQEIITDGILTKKGEQRISSFTDENKEKYYINNDLLSKVTEEPVKFIRERAKNQ